MNIREIRKEIGLSQAEFARILNVHQTAVSQWETGRTFPEAEMLIQISRITGRSVSEILNEGAETVKNAEKSAYCADNGMLGARIAQGDEVFYREDAEIDEGAIVAVDTKDGVLVRYLYERNGEKILVGASGGVAPAVLSENDRILGRVYAFKAILTGGN